MLKDRIEKKNLIINSLIDLQEDDGKGKGRYFVSRFIEPGLAHYKELGDIVITKETLDKFIQSMVGCPVIIDHKDVTDKNVDKLRVGTISRVWFNEQDGWYYCEGILTDDEAIDLVKNQGWNVSCSYSFVSDDTQKTYHGKPIDMVFTDGEFLHLAIVEDPRYEGANIVVNKKDDDIEWITVKGNHIPVKKGQSKDEAVKEFLKDKEGKSLDKKEETKKELIDDINGFKKEYPINTKFYEKYFGKNVEHSIKEIKYDKIDGVKIVDENGKEHFPFAKDITLTKEKNNLEKDKNIERNKSLLKTDLTHMLKDIDRSANYRFEDSTQRLQVNDFGLWEKNEDGELQPTKETKKKIEQIKDAFKKRFNLDLDSTWSEKKLYTFSIKCKVNNNIGDITMQVLDELKNFILGVVNNEKEDEMKVENEDKRKLIDEIGGILKDKVDDEIIRTVIKKAEELSYEPSEDDKADNKCKNEEDEDKKETENKCKNEDEKEDKKEDEKVEDEDDEDEDVTKNEDKDEKEEKEEKEVKNSMKDLIMGGNGKVEEQKLYTSRKERLEEGNKY